jgi:pyridoxine/pyridoxamine 5'-phosphate oxidase
MVMGGEVPFDSFVNAHYTLAAKAQGITMIISESDCPFTLFQNWYQHAEAAEINDPNAANLCTVDHQGRPSSRIILVKQVDNDGFAFFTKIPDWSSTNSSSFTFISAQIISFTLSTWFLKSS